MSCHRDGARTPADALESSNYAKKRGKRQVHINHAPKSLSGF